MFIHELYYSIQETSSDESHSNGKVAEIILCVDKRWMKIFDVTTKPQIGLKATSNNATEKPLREQNTSNSAYESYTSGMVYNQQETNIISTEKEQFVLNFVPNKQHFVHGILREENPLRVVSIVDAPFLYEDATFQSQYKTCIQDAMVCKKPFNNGSSTTWSLTCCFGYSVDLISEIAKNLGLRIELYLVEDKKYGGFIPEQKTFSGMVGDVLKEKADIALAGLTITKQRMEYVDFTTPFMRTEIGIITLKTIKTNSDYLNLNFISNLAEETRIAIISFFTLAMFVIFGMDNIVLYFKGQFDRFYRNRSQPMYPVYECFTYISGLAFQRDLGGQLPNTLGGKVTALFFAFGMMAISTVYTASLTASQVVVSEQEYFSGLKDPRVRNLFSLFN